MLFKLKSIDHKTVARKIDREHVAFMLESVFSRVKSELELATRLKEKHKGNMVIYAELFMEVVSVQADYEKHVGEAPREARIEDAMKAAVMQSRQLDICFEKRVKAARHITDEGYNRAEVNLVVRELRQHLTDIQSPSYNISANVANESLETTYLRAISSKKDFEKGARK